MLRHIRPSFLSSAAVLLSGAAFAADAPLPFAEATFTEVVNDVQIVSRTDAKAVKAVKDARFTAPDLVKTGRKSRAQLTGADGTIARVGSNAVFSFDKSSRTINLESGSVLFHSPTGKGGGTIVTNSATASVIGTTIIVTATSNGGFKLLVLEGVAKVQFPNGQVATVNAGQMTFVMPGATVENKSDGASGSSSQDGDKPAKGGSPGPVLNFDLGSLASDSGLVKGFATELPSIGKIVLATGEQGERLAGGELKATGLFIVGAQDDKEFLVADPNAVQQAQLLSQPELLEATRLDRALRESFTFDGSAPIPERYIFRTPVRIFPEMFPSGVTVPDDFVVGVLIGHLELNSPVFNLGFIDGAADELTVAGLGASSLVIPGDITFNGLAKSRMLRIAGGHLRIADNAKVDVVFDNVVIGSPTKAEFVSLTGAHFTGVSFRNATGTLELGAMLGDLKLDNVTAVAGDKNAANLDPARLVLHVEAGSVILNGGTFRSTGEFFAEISGDITASGADILAGGFVHLQSGASVALSATTVSSASGLRARAAGDFRATNSTLSSANGSISLEATGIALNGATITAPGPVDLKGTGGVAINATINSPGGVHITSSTGSVNFGASTISVGTAPTVNFPTPPVAAEGGSGNTLLNGGSGETVPTNGPLAVMAPGGTSGIDIEGEGVSSGAAAITTSGAIRINGRGVGVTLTGASLAADGIDIDGATIALTGGALSANRLFIESSPGVPSTRVTIDGTAFNARETVIRANRIDLLNTEFHSGSTATFRVTTGGLVNLTDAGSTSLDGHANFRNVTLGGMEVISGNRVWAPAQNIGDVTAPIHILDFTTADFRGTKKEYALARTLVLNAGSTFTPHSYEFDLGELTLTNADLGLPAAIVLPDIGNDPARSAYEVSGIFAANLTLSDATVDLSRFDINPQVDQYAHADIVARTLSLSGNITVTGLTQTRHLDLRAANFNVAPGTVLNPGLTPDQSQSGDVLMVSGSTLTLPNFTLHNDAGDILIRAMDTLTVTGGSLRAGTTDGVIGGSINLQSGNNLRVDGGAMLTTKSSIELKSENQVLVAGGATHLKGNEVSLNSKTGTKVDAGAFLTADNNLYLSADTGDVVVLNTANLTVGSSVDGTSGNFHASSNSGKIDIAGSTLAVEGDSRLTYDTGTIRLDATQVKLTNSELKTYDSNLGQIGKYIEINASALVSINGGVLKASDIIVRGRNDAQGVYALLDRIDVDANPLFVANTIQDGSNRGVFMEAKTINISNTMFPERTEIRLQSQNGTLNIGSSMFGAVNFIKSVGLRDSVNGDKVLVDASRVANVPNINSAVWVENSVSGNKIYVNGLTQQSPTILGNPSSGSAPIHIQQALPTQTPPAAGSHPGNFAQGINYNVN